MRPLNAGFLALTLSLKRVQQALDKGLSDCTRQSQTDLPDTVNDKC